MKLLFIVIILSIIVSILSIYEIELTNGYYKYFSTINPKNSYQFNIAAEYGQNVDIEVRRNYSIISSEFDNCYAVINEYTGKGSKKIRTTNYCMNHKDYGYKISYDINFYSSSSCFYLSFQLEPENILKQVYVRAIVTTNVDDKHIYNLTNATSLFVGSMYNYFYKFYIPAKYDQTVNFKLTRRQKSSSSNTNITCYEYHNRQAIIELRKERTPLSYYYEPHYYKKSFRALNPQTQYIAFELRPADSLGEVDAISYILSPTIFEYDLESGKSQSISQLKFENTYKFYLPVKHRYTVEITLNERRYSYSTLNQYKMTIYEYLNRKSTKELRQKIVDLSYDSKTETYTYLYNVYNESANYLLAELKPPCEEASVSVRLYAIIPPDFEYNINSFTTYKYDNLSDSKTYKFYILAKDEQTLDIEFTNDIFNENPSQTITVYEYSDRYEKKELNKFERKFDYISNLNTFILTFNVGIYYSPYPVKYVAFEIKPYCSMGSVNITANVNNAEGYKYYLYNETQLYLKTLLKNRVYKFQISAKYNQIVEFELNKSDSTYIEYLSIYVYEYSNYPETKLSEKYVSFKKSNLNSNSFKLSYPINNPSTSYIILEIRESNYYLISVYLKPTVKKHDFEIDLINGFSKSIEIFQKFTYKFYIPAKYHQRVEIKFDGSLHYLYSSQYINVYEYNSRTYARQLRNTSLNLYCSRKNYNGDYYYSSPLYTIYYPYTTFVAFEITPNSEWGSVYASPIITSWATYVYDLTSRKSANLEFLSSEEIARFYISATYNQTINIKFTQENSGNSYSQTQKINIYEFPNKTSLEELRYVEFYLYYNSKKKCFTHSYTVYDTSTTFVAFELKPDFSMNEVIVKATIGSFDDETDDKTDDETTNILAIILPILFVICVVAIVIFVYKKNHRKNDNQLQNLTLKTTNQPLYPISQDN